MKTQNIDRENNAKFIQNLSKIMNKKQLNRNQVAKRSMLDGSYVYRLFKGARSVPKPATLSKLARGFDISEEQMYKLAGLDKSKTSHRKTIVSYDPKQGCYIYNGKKVSPDDWNIIKAMLDKITR